ncbi:MAG: putative lysyl-tRNA synthetase [Blastococcus sp.]|nr:putative lysyl-tRNA synthetase [Blastococcus sp.]
MAIQVDTSAPGRARSDGGRSGADRWREPVARVIGAVVSLAAIWSVLSVVVRGDWRQAGEELFGLVNLPVGPNLFSVVLLVLLAGALRRRLRFALWILVLFQVLAIVDGAALVGLSFSMRTDSLLNHFNSADRADLVISVAAALILIPLLISLRRAFPARLYPASRRSAALILVGGAAVSVVVALTLTWLFPDTLATAGERILWALRVVVGVDTGHMGQQGILHRGHHWIAAVVGLLSAVALVTATVVFLRAARAKLFIGAQDELEVRELLRGSGARDSLGYFATRRDKSVVFSPDRTAAVTHRVLASVSLASGDPIGAPEHWAPAISSWLREARSYGWYPAVLGAGEEAARAYVAAGLKAIPLGDEAVIDVRGFTLRAVPLRPIRRAAERVARAGYEIRIVRHGDLTADELAEMGRRAEEWRGSEPERGFSMALNRLGDPTDEQCIAVLAYDRSGRLRGVQSYVPWGANGLSLDLMRRDDDAENGVTEAMIAALIQASPDLGVARVSLNFAVLRGVFEAAERVAPGPLVRTGNAALTFASRLWQLQTLYTATARYKPRWEPRFLCYDSAFALPRVAVASMMAEGFLPAPKAAPPSHVSDTVTWRGRTGVPLREAVAALNRLPPVLTTPARRLTPEQHARTRKLEVLRAAGMDPYPVAVPRTCEVSVLREKHGGLPSGTRTGDRQSVSGRIRALRDFGGLVFADLQDGADHIQVLLTRDTLGPDRLRLWQQTVDLGDHVSVTGEVMASDSGELSVCPDAWVMAAKSIEPLPKSRARFTDPEARVRKRHLDLILNQSSMDTVLARSRAVRALREVLAARGFDEVETPVLQAVHGGAQARPFVTTINAYGLPLYLRIAPELYLKRLAVSGMQRVFELGRNFRNEGADATHNPEFTALEVYQAFADYNVMRDLTRDLILAAAVAVHGAPVAHRTLPDGRTTTVDLAVPWPVVPVHEAVSKATGTELTPATGRDDVLAVCRAHGVHVPLRATVGEAVVALYEALVEPRTTTPTFYTDFPVETSPLTRPHRSDPRLAERWDLVAFGAELGTAYSELIDPVEQRRRLTEQSLRAAAGDAEAMQLDEDFVSTLGYAMPPTGGLGLGVDRLVMLLTGGTIRSTLTFPFVKPERTT